MSKTTTTLRNFVLACAIALPGMVLHSQTVFFAWADQIGGTGYDYSTSMAIDNLGNTYTTGQFRGTVDFDPGSGTSNLTASGVEDIFVLKTDANGQFQWAVAVGGSGQDIGNEIAVDANGYVYVVGLYTGTVDFNPGAGTSNLTSQVGTSTFVLKLTPTATFVWARSIGSNLGTSGEGLSVDAIGTSHIAGNFSGTGDLDPGAGTSTAITTGNIDIFLIELDSAGNFQWGIDFGGSGADACAAITQDVNGEIYMTGYFSGACDFDPTSSASNLTATGVDCFVTKYTTSGGLSWAKQLGGGGTDGGADVTVDFSGNVYTTGYFDGTADFDPGAGTHNFTAGTGISDAFVSCLTTTGTYSWAAQLGGSSVDAGQAISLDINGNVYTTGRFSTTADFDPGVGTSNLTSAGTYDVFVSKLSPSGVFGWAAKLGGASNDVGNAIGLDPSNNVFVTGYFAGTADMDPQASAWTLTSNGQDDMFLVKLIQSGVGIDEPETNNELIAYPNPTSGELLLQMPVQFNEIQINIYSSNGQLVKNQFCNSAAGPVLVDMTDLEPGMYMIEVLTADGPLYTEVIR